MAKQSDWKKTTGTVTNVRVKNTMVPQSMPGGGMTVTGNITTDVEVKALNPITGKQETFTGKVMAPGKGWFGTDADVTGSVRKGETVDVYVDPDTTLWWRNFRIVKKS